MLLVHALSVACHRERQAAAALRRAARKARKVACTEISHGRTLTRKLTDSLYELVDHQTRERYEARRGLD